MTHSTDSKKMSEKSSEHFDNSVLKMFEYLGFANKDIDENTNKTIAETHVSLPADHIPLDTLGKEQDNKKELQNKSIAETIKGYFGV